MIRWPPVAFRPSYYYGAGHFTILATCDSSPIRSTPLTTSWLIGYAPLSSGEARLVEIVEDKKLANLGW
jgi:hypothetical protein